MRFGHIARTLTATEPWKNQTVTPGALVNIPASWFNSTTAAGFYIYVPKNLTESPGVIAASHYCTGTAQAYYNGTPYPALGEIHNFITIYPESPHDGRCWDVSSKATLTHDGGGDSNTIANMVKWTVQKYGADPEKVFATGTSSGAMMTNVLAATYPDIFKAGTVYSGVAAGCFVSATGGVDAWNNTCQVGGSVNSPQVWAQVAFDMYPGYDGPRPKMQIYHGDIDTAVYPANYNETLKQWSGVFGYNYSAPVEVIPNDPHPDYTRQIFGPELQGIYAHGVGHTVPVQGDEDMKWFGFV